MSAAQTGITTHVSIHLARFDEVGALPDSGLGPPAGAPLRWLVGADEGRHGSPLSSQLASEFVAVGLHGGQASATACAAAPVGAFADATELWSGAFRPVRALGECNWMGPLETSGSVAGGALAVLTSGGWVFDDQFDMDRVMRFATGVDHVRSAMDDVEGLHSGQVFRLPDFTADAFTLTFWRSEAAMRSFAYQPGAHKTELDAFRLNETADRTSFTRLQALTSHGTWWGTDPFA